uniref:Uncharacterized protein n=1 Tax=Chromera velia CCMP2878 TaxID=1169474 RepID=A0A0G4FLB4_9ALVE|eukprot:Cvel_17574.t1-p1 / transcript=Cvel_17574.t1 / gene=Cvel_17574 / organism=Chromera_velia_CCMP2878 / gene_product=hypothetical protein / transcript_product=hypothetical protein / location=Cvel_scaffold1412:11316-12854(-) / protein_length=513 / sequence_SO=supercontig / SO=protein_coding / is_pseudo=false
MRGGGILLLILLFVSFGAWISLLIEHSQNVKNVQFQALYSRLVSLYPLMMTVAIVSALIPVSSIYLENVFSWFEVYVILAFLALLLGLGWLKVDVKEALFQKKGGGVVSCCGPRETTPEKQFAARKALIMQYAVVNPLVAIAKTVHFEVAVSRGDLGNRSRLVGTVLQLITAVSLIIAFAQLLRIYWVLKKDKRKPYEGKHVIGKVAVIKFIFGFAVLNRLVLKPLIRWGVIPTGDFICPPEAVMPSERYAQFAEVLCEDRMVNMLLTLELFVFTFLSLAFYRHVDFSTPSEVAENFPLPLPATAGEAVSSASGGKKKTNKVSSFLLAVMRFFDLSRFWRGEVEGSERERTDGGCPPPLADAGAERKEGGGTAGGLGVREERAVEVCFQEDGGASIQVEDGEERKPKREETTQAEEETESEGVGERAYHCAAGSGGRESVPQPIHAQSLPCGSLWRNLHGSSGSPRGAGEFWGSLSATVYGSSASSSSSEAQTGHRGGSGGTEGRNLMLSSVL